MPSERATPRTRRLSRHRLVRRQQRIGDVPQVDLELVDAVFRHGTADRQLLHRCGFIDARQELRHVLDRIQREISGAPWRRATRQCAQGQAAVRLALWVNQVELELAGHHRMESGGAAFRHHVGEDLARIEPQFAARAQIGHLADHLRGGCRRPRHALQEPAQRSDDAVGITVGLAHAAGVVPEPAAVRDQRAGRVHRSFLVELDAIGGRQALAGGVAVEVDDEGVDRLDIGVGGLESLPFSQRSVFAGSVSMHD